MSPAMRTTIPCMICIRLFFSLLIALFPMVYDGLITWIVQRSDVKRRTWINSGHILDCRYIVLIK